MPTTADPRSRLVADIGGTNSRLALHDNATGELRELRTYSNRDYPQFEAIVGAWLDALREPQPADCCLAIAAPPFVDQVNMINMDWSFSLEGLARQFGFARLRGINDFEGNAHALPHLGPDELLTLHVGQVEAGKLATVGPGTGLGGATLQWVNGIPLANASEPGHMGLSPASDLELALFQYLLKQHRDLYAELLISGPGLQRLYAALNAVNGRSAPALTPAQISSRGQSGECEHCALTLDLFCALLGSVCGDYVLANGAYAGLYLAGGVLPRMLDVLQQSQFVQRFQEKGKMQPHLARVPLHVITSGVTGLLGAAHAPMTTT